MEQGIPDSIAQPPATGSPTTSLSSGAIVGIIIAIIIAAVVVLVVVIVAIMVARKRDRKYVLTTAAPPGHEEIRYVGARDNFTSSTRSREEQRLLDQSPVHMSVKTDTLPVTAFIETNPGAEICEGDDQTPREGDGKADGSKDIAAISAMDMTDTHL